LKGDAMSVQELMSLVGDKMADIDNIISNAESKISAVEDIRDRATDVSSSLQDHMSNLIGIDDTLDEAATVIDEAESEELNY
tara:strand:+ start:1172 stop:1417 length:246 start_codon:yes stop_codon:yes gene_type:complete